MTLHQVFEVAKYVEPHAQTGRRPIPTGMAVDPTGMAVDPTLPTIFHEPWWLDAVTGGNFHVAEVRHGGALVGRMPYALSRRLGMQVSLMPDMTHLLGPGIDEGNGSSNNRWLRRMDIQAELLGQLPRLSSFSQVCHPETPDVLGFQSSGFNSAVQFSAEIQPASEAVLWSAMRDKTRNVIRRSQERSNVEFLADTAELVAFYARNLALAGACSYFDLGIVERAFAAASARDRARIVVARDSRKQLVASLMYVWDQRRLWYLLSSRDRTSSDNGAGSLLVWHAMREAASRALIFDFDGIVTRGSARFFAGFGARIRPRFVVHRSSPCFRLAGNVIALARGDASWSAFTGH